VDRLGGVENQVRNIAQEQAKVTQMFERRLGKVENVCRQVEGIGETVARLERKRDDSSSRAALRAQAGQETGPGNQAEWEGEADELFERMATVEKQANGAWDGLEKLNAKIRELKGEFGMAVKQQQGGLDKAGQEYRFAQQEMATLTLTVQQHQREMDRMHRGVNQRIARLETQEGKSFTMSASPSGTDDPSTESILRRDVVSSAAPRMPVTPTHPRRGVPMSFVGTACLPIREANYENLSDSDVQSTPSMATSASSM
jgi:chromosome segregation ATPase